MTDTYTEVWPDTAVHPGEHVQDFFDEDAAVPIADIAAKAGLDVLIVRRFIDGKVDVSREIAEGLSTALRTPASLWLNLQSYHDRVATRLEENARFDMAPYLDFTASTSGVSPINDLIDKGDVPKRYNRVEQARILCDWLGIPNLDGYDESILGHFQRSNSSHAPKPAPLVVWLRRGELAAEEQAANLPNYCETTLLDGANQVRATSLKSQETFLSAARDACNTAGVAFVAIPFMPGS